MMIPSGVDTNMRAYDVMDAAYLATVYAIKIAKRNKNARSKGKSILQDQ